MNWAKILNPNELDPVIMARNAGLKLDPWQAKLARSRSKRILINCSRQSGKSTTVSVIANHTALYEDNSPILLLSPSLRQSGELFRKCLDVYRELGKPVPAESENKLSLELENGSRIISLPGKEGTTRGFSGVKLLIIDEASKVPDELYMSVRPMLAVSGGRLIVLSSPFGARGFFYEIYKNRHNWEYYEVPATQCPRITPEFLAEEKENMGEYWFNQEYMCKFLDAQTSAFRAEDIEQIVKPGLEMWDL
jgi:hypothetical protein